MWAIRLYDGKPGLFYLRESLLDGRILIFDKEEAMLRFLFALREKLEPALGVRMQPVRFTDDPRKARLYKVPDGNAGMLIQYLCAYV